MNELNYEHRDERTQGWTLPSTGEPVQKQEGAVTIWVARTILVFRFSTNNIPEYFKWHLKTGRDDLNLCQPHPSHFFFC